MSSRSREQLLPDNQQAERPQPFNHKKLNSAHMHVNSKEVQHPPSTLTAALGGHEQRTC